MDVTVLLQKTNESLRKESEHNNDIKKSENTISEYIMV